jgi:type II restriction enzyme
MQNKTPSPDSGKNTAEVSAESAVRLLQALEFSPELCNRRCALTLLALAKLKAQDRWEQAGAPLMTVLEIMDWIESKWSRQYKPNSREAIRRLTLHPFIEAGIVEQNADRPDRPINSPYWNYRLRLPFLKAMRLFGSDGFEAELRIFNSERTTWLAKTADPRHLHKMPAQLPNGAKLALSPGGQSHLIKAVIEEFCPRFARAASVLFVGDTDKVRELIDAEMMKKLGLVLPERGKEPDLIVWDRTNKWIFLIEACFSHGPIDVVRKEELRRIFGGRNDLIFVSCFPDRKVMQKHLSHLAWETVCWCADTPDHLIHMDGDRILGPYGK